MHTGKFSKSLLLFQNIFLLLEYFIQNKYCLYLLYSTGFHHTMPLPSSCSAVNFSFFFTCEFIRHNAFVSSWFFISWLGVQTQPAPNLWRISRSVAGVVNPYSSETVEFSPNFAFRRTVKACRSYFWRLSYIQKEENPKTVEKNNTQQFFVTKTEGELSFGKYWINFLHKAVRIANS